MAKARLSFTCLRDSGETGPVDDAPYFVVWVGDHTKPGGASKAVRVRKEIWDDATAPGDSGSATVDFGPLALSGLVLVALIEEDGAPDNARPPTLAQRVTSRMNDWDHNLAGAVGTNALANHFRLRFRDTIRDYLVNDDLLATRRFKVPQTLPMTGDQALYRVTLKGLRG